MWAAGRSPTPLTCASAGSLAGKVRYTRKHYGHLTLFVARLGATAAYLTSYPVWILQWLRRGITASEFRAEAKKYWGALLEAWRV